MCQRSVGYRSWGGKHLRFKTVYRGHDLSVKNDRYELLKLWSVLLMDHFGQCLWRTNYPHIHTWLIVNTRSVVLPVHYANATLLACSLYLLHYDRTCWLPCLMSLRAAERCSPVLGPLVQPFPLYKKKKYLPHPAERMRRIYIDLLECQSRKLHCNLSKTASQGRVWVNGC